MNYDDYIPLSDLKQITSSADLIVNIEDILTKSNLVWDIEYRPKGRYYVIRVAIDPPVAEEET